MASTAWRWRTPGASPLLSPPKAIALLEEESYLKSESMWPMADAGRRTAEPIIYARLRLFNLARFDL
jgi:hypothetical protein